MDDSIIKRVKNLTVPKKGTSAYDDFLRAIRKQQDNQREFSEVIYRENTELLNKLLVFVSVVLGLGMIINLINFFWKNADMSFKTWAFIILVLLFSVPIGAIVTRSYNKNIERQKKMNRCKDIEEIMMKKLFPKFS